MQRAKGFTLIELIVVIVILGILAATALPRFIDFRTDAARAAVSGVAGGITSGSALNYAGSLVGGKTLTPSTLSGVACGAGMSGLIAGGLPTGYAISGASTCSTAGTTITCAVIEPSVSATANATITCY